MGTGLEQQNYNMVTLSILRIVENKRRNLLHYLLINTKVKILILTFVKIPTKCFKDDVRPNFSH